MVTNLFDIAKLNLETSGIHHATVETKRRTGFILQFSNTVNAYGVDASSRNIDSEESYDEPGEELKKNLNNLRNGLGR